MELKEQIRLTVSTAINLISVLAPSMKLDSRVIAAIEFAKHLVEEHWDELWAIGEKDPEIFNTLFNGLV